MKTPKFLRVFVLLALVLYQAPELVGRFRAAWPGVGRLSTGDGKAPAG